MLLILQPSSNKSPVGYNLHQLQGNKMHGSQKTGYLLKKSEGKVRKVWQKRKCTIHDGIMLVSHSDVREIFCLGEGDVVGIYLFSITFICMIHLQGNQSTCLQIYDNASSFISSFSGNKRASEIKSPYVPS